jgi:hypothetical protein
MIKRFIKIVLKRNWALPGLAFAFLMSSSVSVSAQSLFPDLGGQRNGISGFQFLKIGVGARGEGIGEAAITTVDDATALYWNPALAVDVLRNEVSFTYGSWLVDMTHASANAVYHLTGRDALGFGIISLTSPQMERTTELSPDGTGDYFNYYDFAASLTYSRRMTEQFSFGLTARYIRESIAEIKLQTVLFDLGILYKVPFAGIRFAATISNFGSQTTPSGMAVVPGVGNVSSFSSVNPPTLFRLGFSLEPIHTSSGILTTSLVLNHPNDNSENLCVGAEYNWQNVLFLRIGYRFGVDEQNMPTLGAGLLYDARFGRFRFDYAFANFSTLGPTHRITVSVGNFKF